MRTRRIHRIAAAMVTLTVLATGCSSGSSDGGSAGPSGGGAALPPCPVDALEGVSSPVNLVLWHTQQAKPLDALTDLANKYNASQSKVHVDLEAQGTSFDELMRKFQSAVPSKQLPGIVMFDDTATKTLADSGVILPAQSCVDADHYDTSGFLPVARNYYTIDGTLWPASAGIGNVLLFYNKNHFRRAGLDPDKPPTTLEEMRQDAEKIKAVDVTASPVVQEMASWKTEFWLTGAGSSVVDNDNGRGSAQTTSGTLHDNPQAQQLFDWFDQMNGAGLLQPVPATAGQINQYLAMANQTASMLVESSSTATSIEAFLSGNLKPGSVAGLDQVADTSGLDFGAAVLPGLDASSTGKTQMGGAAYYMTNTGPPEQQAAAWDFMKFMNTDESQTAMLVGGSFLPYRTSAADTPAAQEFFSSSLAGQWLKLANEQVSKIDPDFPGPLIGPYDEFRRAIDDAQDQMMFNHRSPSDVLADAQTAVDKALQRYNSESFN